MILKRKKKININFFKDKINRHNIYRNFFLFIMGMSFSAISVSVFFEVNDVVTTGNTGLAIIISKLTNVDLSILVFALSSIFLVLGLLLFGLEYSSKNILGTILYPVFIKAASVLNNFISFENTSLFLLILIGAILSGIGFGLVKRSGYSLGGFYVLYDLLHQKLKISVGKANLFCNVLIIFSSIFIFGLDKCIYALIGLYVSSYVGDKIMIGISTNKAFYIATKKPLEVRDYIINNLNHTVTIVNAKTGNSIRKRKMLLCVIPTTEYNIVKEVIKEIDNSAFFLITDSYYVSK